MIPPGSWAPSSAEAEILLQDDFEYFPPNSGVHSVSPPAVPWGTTAPLNTVWDNVRYWHKSHAIRIICNGTAASGHCFLSESFVPGHEGGSELRTHAEQAPTVWNPPSEEVWIRHFVRWPDGWQWPREFSSLKLGRLRLEDSCRRGEPCIESYWGLRHGDPDHIQWVYAHTADGNRWSGDQVAGRWPRGFQTGRWYCLELHVRQNTRVDPANGIMELYVDGQLVASNRSVNTRGEILPERLLGKFLTLPTISSALGAARRPRRRPSSTSTESFSPRPGQAAIPRYPPDLPEAADPKPLSDLEIRRRVRRCHIGRHPRADYIRI